MTLEFHEITFNGMRSKAGSGDLAWSRLILSFKDTDTNHFPLVELTLLQTTRPETTIAELENEATDRAKTILRAALDVLEENSVASLLQKQVQTDEAARQSLNETSESPRNKIT